MPSSGLIEKQPQAVMDRWLNYVVIVIISQSAGGCLFGLTMYWMQHYQKGFDWGDKPATFMTEFNYHPTLLTTGLVVLYGEAMLVYRVLWCLPKRVLKAVHALLMLCVIAISVVGLVVAWRFHKHMQMKKHLYSLHSWIGLCTVTLFCAQWLCGFAFFLLPLASPRLRRVYLGLHSFFGVAIFVAAGVSCISGLVQKGSSVPEYSLLSVQARLVNCIAMVMIVYVASVTFILSKEAYRLQSRLEEISMH